MPSFDIVSKVDPQMLDNAVNVTKKEITTSTLFLVHTMMVV